MEFLFSNFSRFKSPFISTLPMVYQFLGLFIFVTYLLRGCAFKKLLGGYLGFVPIAGDIACMSQIGDRVESRYKTKYIVWASISKFIKCILIFLLNNLYIIYALILFMSFLQMITGEEGSFNFGLTMFVLITIFVFLICFLSMFVDIYYRFKILLPFIKDKVSSADIGFSAFVFAIFPMIFYIWILSDNSTKDGNVDGDVTEI